MTVSVEVAPLTRREKQAPVTTADVLNRAADLLEEFGWTQGFYAYNERGECCDPDRVEAVTFCCVGALSRASGDLGMEDLCRRAEIEVEDAVGLHIPFWNDAEGRTKADVVGVLREAARRVSGASSGAGEEEG